jgi:hypothetical protein
MDGRKFCRAANLLTGDGPLRRTGRHDVKRSPPDHQMRAVTVATFRDDPLFPKMSRAVEIILEKDKVV